MKVTTAVVVSALLPMTALGETSEGRNEGLRFEFGANLGWGGPYGSGAEAAYYVTDGINLNGGIGLSMSGFKAGLGTKYFFMADNDFSPFVGVCLAHSGGLPSVNVNLNEDSAVYDITSGTLVSVKTGFRYAVKWANLYANLGYAISLSGGEAVYVSGSRAAGVKSFAETVGEPQGIEVSVGVSFRLHSEGGS